MSLHTPHTPQADLIVTRSSHQAHPKLRPFAFDQHDEFYRDDFKSDDVVLPTPRRSTRDDTVDLAPRRSTRLEISQSLAKIVDPFGANEMFPPLSQNPHGEESAFMHFQAPSSQPLTLRLSQREDVPIVQPRPAISLGPVILPGGHSEISNVSRRNLIVCDSYRSILASADCLYMSNINDRAHIATMQRAFESITYEFSHDVPARARISKASFASEPKWVDHAFWVARHFFTVEQFPDTETRIDLVRSFFIISMRLFWVEGGFSNRLAPTLQYNGASGDITSGARPAAASRATYANIGHLPTSMPPLTTFRIGASAAFWPASVGIQDLWEHDICALFVLVPELVTAVVMSTGQHQNAAAFRQLLHANTYWPAVCVGNEICVVIDECVRKICAIQLLSYDEASFQVKTLTTPYWPVAVAGQRKRATKAAAAAPEFPFPFNRCRRTDASEFWLTPFVKWNETQTRTAFPSKLRAELDSQTHEQKTKIAEARDPGQLATMYPHLYMNAARRVLTLARYSNTIQVDTVGEAMRHKCASVATTLSGV